MDLHDANARAKCLIRDRDARYPAAFDAALQAEGIKVIQIGLRIPRTNAITERWVRSRQAELPGRTLIRNETLKGVFIAVRWVTCGFAIARVRA